MSAVTQTQAPARPAAGGIPFSRLLQVEFRKSWDTRASFWLLFSLGAIVLVAELITAIVTGVQNVDDVQFGTFATVAGFISQLLLPVLGIMLVTSEWSQRTAMVTFSLEPRRGRVVQAKMAVGLIWTALTVVFALLMGAIFNLLYGAIAGNIDWSGGAGITGFIITQTLAMLLGFALAALLLNTPAAIVIYFAYLFALPTILAIGAALMDWFKSFQEWINYSDAQNPLYDGFWNMSGSEWGKLLVSCAIWFGIPLTVGLRRILRAEVK
ncbi:ABC transporter permease [Nocardioides sp. Iso805N]|uniref:ABC transporter permease n=1 Tax=Nocardioides sp. Iso805N TaxID=1283287 RepID=UPI00035DC00E|nr:ABC transporter permease [Nocardioides sp. Iso805N]